MQNRCLQANNERQTNFLPQRMDRPSIDIGKLRRMSHVELQGLAKSLHIKANQKTEKLRDAIIDHVAEDDDVSSDDVTENEEVLEAAAIQTSEADQKDAKQLENELQEPSERKLRRRTYELTPSGQAKMSETDGESQHDDGVRAAAFSPVKTPKLKLTSMVTKCDRSVGRTPVVKRTYELRSKKGGENGGVVKSMIPRPKAKTQKTPNFSKIHEAAFAKLENLSEYVSKKRTLMENYKSFALRTGNRKLMSGKAIANKQTGDDETVFQPSVLTTTKMNLDFSKMNPLPPKTPKPMLPIAAKTPLKASSFDASRPTFDLKQSLARKLRYQPHKGPLKPLTETVSSTNVHCGGAQWKAGSHLNAKRRLNERTENRDILRGVRRNRRLDLQLKMRGVID